MQTKTDCSYGVIPLTQEDGVWKVLLIYQISHGGEIYWTLPKGHPEEGETPEESAQRELFEETGITVKHLDASKTFTQSYDFVYENVRVEKTVVYYLGFVQSTDFALQEAEVQEAQWLSLDEAMEKVTHENAKNMLQDVMKVLAT